MPRLRFLEHHYSASEGFGLVLEKELVQIEPSLLHIPSDFSLEKTILAR